MIISFEDYLNRLAEKTVDNTKQLRKAVQQRRNGMEDLYGTFFTAEGDADNPATFFISVSPDMVYLEQLAFKFVIRPYTTTVKGGTSSETVSVNNRSLAIENDSITPNPHNHSTDPHTHNLIKGKAFVQTASDYWRVHIAGVDITPYLIEQHNGEWIDMSEGDSIQVFPNHELDGIEDFYDILGVASMMYEENTEESLDDVEKLLKPEFKRVEIFSDAPFGCDAYLYTKYPNLNR